MEADGKALLSSPISVVGFACASSDLPSPRSSGGSSGRARSSVSLLSLLLTSQHGSAAGRSAAAEDCYDGFGSEDNEDGDEDDEDVQGFPRRAHGSQGTLHHHASDAAPSPLRRATTAPMDVPSAIWLREPLHQHELRKLHYERCVRRAQMEALQQQQAQQQQQQMRQAYQCQQQQQQLAAQG